MVYESVFKSKLDHIKQENRYREFIPLSRVVGNMPYAIWHGEEEDFEKEVVIWCTNDYLGMSHHPKVLDVFKDAALTYGVGSGGTRNISGTLYHHGKLEELVAQLHGKDAGLLFTSGYTANEGALSAIIKAFDNMIVFSDEKNHSSIIHGIRSGGAQKHVFSHSDMDALERLLSLYPKEQPKLIVVTSVYSMHGDFAPLEKICALSKKYNALLYVDEVHAVGLYGKHGGGLCEQLGLSDQVDVIQGNFAKAYGVVGGYITANKHLVDYIRSSASGFIFTTSLPPSITLASYASVSHLMQNDGERKLFWNNVSLLKEVLDKTNLFYLRNNGHIVPVIVKDALKCKDICRRLLHEFGIYVQPINYPTVKRGEEMIRITVTPYHSKTMIYDLVHALEEVIYNPTEDCFRKAA